MAVWSWLLVGLLVGGVARWLLPGGGLAGLLGMSMLGAVAGGHGAVQMGYGSAQDWHLIAALAALSGAVSFLVILGILARGRASSVR